MPKVPSGKAGWNGKTRASAAPRPSAPRDQRTGSAYIFGAICPARGAGAALVLPICNSTTMSMQLAEISQAVSPGAHAVLLLDQAGRHTSGKLSVPANVSLVPPRVLSGHAPQGRRTPAWNTEAGMEL